MHFNLSSFLIVADIEKKLFDMIVLSKSEVLELQINDLKFKEKIAELEELDFSHLVTFLEKQSLN